MNIQMTYAANKAMSPYGFCWSPALDKSIERFGKQVYKITLGFGDHDGHEPFYKDIEQFKKAFEESIGMTVQNKLIYRSVSGKPYVSFFQLDKGQPPPLCYLEGGHKTEPPIDGDTVRVVYTLGGWFNPEEKKAGLKLYLDAVEVAVRTGIPKIHHPVEEDWEWE